jgi:hypothetical protein
MAPAILLRFGNGVGRSFPAALPVVCRQFVLPGMLALYELRGQRADHRLVALHGKFLCFGAGCSHPCLHFAHAGPEHPARQAKLIFVL